jgi:hypothetical protein
MPQVVEYLPSMQKALGLVPGTAPNPPKKNYLENKKVYLEGINL